MYKNENVNLKDTLIIAGNDYSNIEAKTVWGALRGDSYITLLLNSSKFYNIICLYLILALETFSQLIVVKDGLVIYFYHRFTFFLN